MAGDAPGMAAGGYDAQRYNPAMRKVWPWPSVLLERVEAWMRALPGPLWLDAACGEGHLGHLVGASKCLLGLDVDSQRLRKAQRHSYRSLMRGSLSALPLAAASLDGIASVETLEHVPDLDGALAECARCLRPQGHLVITVPSVTLRSWWAMRRTGQPVYCSEREHVREFSSMPIHEFPHMFETWERFEGRLRAHGFDVVNACGVGFLLPMWTGRLAWLERGMNLLYRESSNEWVGALPVLRRFPYYRMYLLRKRGDR